MKAIRVFNDYYFDDHLTDDECKLKAQLLFMKNPEKELNYEVLAPKKITVEVRGGNIVNYTAADNIIVEIVDYDNMESDADALKRKTYLI